MSFKDLRHLTETVEQKKNAASGFEERLKAHEKRFKEDAEALEPSKRFYERTYDI